MKKLLSLSLLILACLSTMQAVGLFLDVARFQSMDAEQYIETYITVDGSTVRYMPTDQAGDYRAKVTITVRMLRLEESGDTTQHFVDRYNLISPAIQDTSMEARQAFPDLKRIVTPPGLYSLSITAQDYHNPKASTKHVLVIKVPPTKADSFAFSDVEFIAGLRETKVENVFSKHGIDVIPFGLEGTFINQDSLLFYIEMYNTDKAFKENFFAEASLYRGEEQLFQHIYTVKKAPAKLDILTGGFRIADLPPSMGAAYSLRVKLFNKNNNNLPPLIQRVFIYSEDMLLHQPIAQASTIFDKLTDEEVQYYIPTLMYLTESDDEVRLARALRTPDDRRNYLASYWQKRAEAEESDLGLMWARHRFAIKYANENYASAFEDGWKTDRGRIFVKYGPPSDIERYPNERNHLPYELWKFDKLGTQAQVVFIFVDQDRATNSYVLLHSTKYGELQNPTWRSDLLQPGASNQGARLQDLRGSGSSRVDYEADSRSRTRIGN